MLPDVAEPLHSGILALELFHRRAQLLLRQIEWLVCHAACLQNDLMHIAPSLDVSQFLSLWEGELLAILHLIRFVIESEHTLRHDLSGVENPCQCRSEQVTFFPAEDRVSIDICVQIAGEDMLDLARLDEINRSAIW